MAPIKRKAAPYDSGRILPKRPKKVEIEVTEKKRSKIAEVESDSDPIIESDTADESGEDDGVSWPSDEEVEDEVEDDDEDGGVEVVTLAANAKKSNGQSKKDGSMSASSTSRESHAKQKATAQERKAAKPNADQIARSKKLWEQLRRKSHVKLEERKKLIAELFDIITGRTKDFVFKHDGVRVIQTALKYANIDQRKMIATELKGEYKNLMESRYAKFLVGKLLVHGDKDIRDWIVPELYGHVRRMIKHPEASWILDDVYRGAATLSQKAVLLREWYGAEFALFKSQSQGNVSGDLKDVLAESPEKRKPVMRSLHEMINLLVQKKTTGFTMLHDAMLQYYLNVQQGSEEATEFIELLKGDEEGDLLKNLAFTQPGSRLVCLVLAYSTAKDRKLIIRAYKGIVPMMAYDVNAHHVILTAYDVIDDTVLTNKTIISELLGNNSESEDRQKEFLDAADNLVARTSFLYPFSGRSKAILSNEDLKILDEVDTIRKTTSKKDPETRQKELVSHLSAPLLALIENNAVKLVSSSFGCQFITEVLLSAQRDRTGAVTSLLSIVDADREVQDHFQTPHAGRMLKLLVQGGHFNTATKTIQVADPPLNFHNAFYLKIFEDVIEWSTGENSFVIVGLLEAPGFDYKDKLMKRLKKGKARLEEAAATGDRAKEPAKKKGKGKDDSKHSVKGNAGSRILLQKLGESPART